MNCSREQTCYYTLRKEITRAYEIFFTRMFFSSEKNYFLIQKNYPQSKKCFIGRIQYCNCFIQVILFLNVFENIFPCNSYSILKVYFYLFKVEYIFQMVKYWFNYCFSCFFFRIISSIAMRRTYRRYMSDEVHLKTVTW